MGLMGIIGGLMVLMVEVSCRYSELYTHVINLIISLFSIVKVKVEIFYTAFILSLSLLSNKMSTAMSFLF